MQLITAPRDFSTIRFEGSYSSIKQKSYFNFLNLPLTIANFYAFRESYSQLYSSPALQPYVKFTSPRFINSWITSDLQLHFSKNCMYYTVSSISLHGSNYQIGDIACFFNSGLVFHIIRHIIVGFPNNECIDNAEVENTYFICERLQYYYDARLNFFRYIEIEEDSVIVMKATKLKSLKHILLINGMIYPPTICYHPLQ